MTAGTGTQIAAAQQRAIAAWLLLCAALVFAMVVGGGVTRLTHSGLSIVEWQPIVGTLPPLNEAQWEETFAKYRETPEYKQVNQGMTIDAFKGIFWWEYFHRLLGRSIGFIFLLPLLWFAFRKRIDKPLAWKLAGLFVLGGLQGAMGWYMVKSGLVDDPRVSHLRLASHLAIAFVIFAAMVWIALDLLYPRREGRSARPELAGVHRFAAGLALLIFVMVLSGALVAGLHAGLAYNTFPLMQGSVIPPGFLMLDPWWLNFFNNIGTVQFDHRAIAWLLAFLVPTLWFRVRASNAPARARLGAHALLGLLAVQITLGITTLLLVVPVPFAAAHQAVAVLVFGAALYTTHALR